MSLFSLTKEHDVLANTKIIKSKDFSKIVEVEELLKKAKEEIAKDKDLAEKETSKLHQEAKTKGFEEGMQQFSTHILHLEEKIKHMLITMQTQVLPLTLKATKKL